MDIIADTCAIRRIIIIAPDVELLATARRNLRDDWHQIVWDTLWIFPNQTAFMCADWIEIAQDRNFPAVIAVIEIAQHIFDDELRAAIRICCGQWLVFGDGEFFRIAINRGRRAENQRFDACGFHRLQQA